MRGPRRSAQRGRAASRAHVRRQEHVGVSASSRARDPPSLRRAPPPETRRRPLPTADLAPPAELAPPDSAPPAELAPRAELAPPAELAPLRAAELSMSVPSFADAQREAEEVAEKAAAASGDPLSDAALSSHPSVEIPGALTPPPGAPGGGMSPTSPSPRPLADLSRTTPDPVAADLQRPPSMERPGGAPVPRSPLPARIPPAALDIGGVCGAMGGSATPRGQSARVRGPQDSEPRGAHCDTCWARTMGGTRVHGVIARMLGRGLSALASTIIAVAIKLLVWDATMHATGSDGQATPS